jgi:O-antigen/teichoic acid export membrane protein
MIQRLIVIGAFTGIGQLFSLLVIRWMAGNSSPLQLSQLAQFDAQYALVLSIIAFGLQSSAIREIAVQKEWRYEYEHTQSARLMLSILLLPVAAAAYYNPGFAIFILAPLFALSGDYALYARGKAINGAFLAFLRQMIPFLFALLAAKTTLQNIQWYYFLGLAIAYIITNYIISYTLHVTPYNPAKLKNLKLYIVSIPLGIVNISLYTIGMGLLMLVPYFYPVKTVVIAFLGIKFYMVIKGVIRIIHQAFIKEMQQDDACLKVDKLSLLPTISFIGTIVLFPHSSIELIFGSTLINEQQFLLVIALALGIYSFNLSMATRAMLEKKDRQYSILAAVSAVTAILATIIISFFYNGPESVAASLFIGELIFATGLLIILNRPSLIYERLLFILNCSIFFVPVILIRYFLGDTLLYWLLSMGLFLSVVLIANIKSFNQITIYD